MDWVSAGCSLIAFLLYYNTLDGGFVYDDRRAVITNPDVIGHTSFKQLWENDFWGTPLSDSGSHGSYRPLCVATFRLNYTIAGLKPWSYHLLNVLLHCLATCLVIRVARRLLPPSILKVGTAVTGLIFAVHPIHTEAVAGIVGRADLAACNLFLMAFLLYAEHQRLRDSPPGHKQFCRGKVVKRHQPVTIVSDESNIRLSCHGLVQQIVMSLKRLVTSSEGGPLKLLCGTRQRPSERRKENVRAQYVCYGPEWGGDNEVSQWVCLGGTLILSGAGMLCKEPAITVLPICVIYDFVRGAQDGKPNSKKRWRSAWCMSLGGAALLCWRLQVASTPSLFAIADNPAARDTSFITRTLTFAYLPLFNFFLLLWPNNLSFDWSMDSIPRVTSLLDIRNVATVIFFTILLKVTWRSAKSVFTKTESKASINKEQKNFKSRNHNLRRYKNYYYYSTYSGKPYHNGYFHIDRKNYHSPFREIAEAAEETSFCSLPSCRYTLSKNHSLACRAVNNNNVTQYSACACNGVLFKSKVKKPRDLQKQKAMEWHNPHAAVLISLAFLALPFLPASNALFYVGFVVAERVLYIPSVGYSLLVGFGAGVIFKSLKGRSSRYGAAVLVITLIALSVRTFRRNMDWKDEESLFRSAVHINPPRAYGNLGSILVGQGRHAEAEIAFKRALQHRPNMAEVHYNLGILLQNEKRYEEAIKSFEMAIFFRPSMALAYVNLGASLMGAGRTAEAAGALRAGARAEGARVRDRRAHDAARVSALVHLAALHAQRRHWHKALAAYKEALAIIPEHSPLPGWTRQDLLAMVSDSHAHLQQWPQAEQSAEAALADAPASPPALLAYAKLLARNSSRHHEAEQWFKNALELAPKNADIRYQYGEFLRSRRRLSEAADQLVAAARLDPQDGARAAVAAQALRDAERCRAAERWYARAAHLTPQDPGSQSNLGAILHLNGKYAQAAASYVKALKLQPGDEIALTNLKRVRTLMASSEANIGRL